jgi:Holliday junction resolvasome RuvABC endonuclease subunit
MIVVGIDQSMAACGIAVLELRAGEWRFVEAACIRTKPDPKAKHLYKADQDGMRIDEVSIGIEGVLVRQPRPLLVAVEAPAGSQSVSAAKAMAQAYAVARTTCRMLGLAPIVVQAHHAKKAATGSASATKDEVERAMCLRWAWTPTERAQVAIEAIADALAVATAALDEPTVRAMTAARRAA